MGQDTRRPANSAESDEVPPRIPWPGVTADLRDAKMYVNPVDGWQGASSGDRIL